jgi:hypothetical protein
MMQRIKRQCIRSKKRRIQSSKLSAETVLFRKNYLLNAFKSNMTMGMLEGMQECIETTSKYGLSQGYCRELVCDATPRGRSKTSFESDCTLIAQCYPGFGSISDGTPTFCKADAVMLCLVHKETLDIFEVLVCLKLDDTSLNGEQLADNLFQVLMVQCKLSAKNWRVSTIEKGLGRIRSASRTSIGCQRNR